MANRKRTDYIVIHVTATPPGWDKGRAGIDALHKARGWSGIGYNEIINPNGKAEVGRGYDAVGAHVAGFNSIAFGIALVGGVDKANKPDVKTITAAQWATLEKRLRELVKKYPKAVICGHRDLSPDLDKDGIIESGEHIKACPCFDAIPWARNIGLPAANIKGDWDKGTIVPPKAPDERMVYLQRLLSRAGFDVGPVDGIVGKRTKDAIRAYQTQFGLKVSGEFDAATVAHLRSKFEQKAVEEAKKLPVEPAKDAIVVTTPPIKKDETAVIVTPKPTTTPAEQDKKVSKTGWAALGAFILSLVAGAIRYFGGS